MILKTTTWKGRNTHNFELTKKFAIEKNMISPVIIDFGPGGSVDFMARYLAEGRASQLDLWSRFVRVFESFLRKTNLFSLVTNEPREIERVFASLSPRKLHVFDLQKKVIKAVSELHSNGEIKTPFEAHVWNIQKGPVEIEADIVIALNIVSRTTDKSKALSNVASATKIGGLFCINIDDPPQGFKKLGTSVFERVE